MKKLLSLLLCLAVTLCAFSALATATPLERPADTVGAYRVVTPAPDGYLVASGEAADGGLFIAISTPDNEGVQFAVSIRHSEMYDGLSIGDLDEVDLAELLVLFTEDYAAPIVTYGATGLGTKLVIVDEDGSASDYADMFTLYRGYLVAMSLFRIDHATLTDEDFALGTSILTGMTFEELP